MIESIQELLQKEAQAVLNIPVTDAYEKAVELIVEQIHRKKGKLVTSGMGKAGPNSDEHRPLRFVRPEFPLSSCTPARHNTAIWASCKRTTCYY